MGVIVSKEQFCDIRSNIRNEGKKIVLCHGVFDLIHPGHLLHFEEAKLLGDVLVVSITSAPFVRKGPGRPYFNDELRLKFLSSLTYIDYVMLSECHTVDDVVKAVKPDFYVKGQDYANSKEDITGKIDDEAELVKKFGGQVYYTTGQTFSSTNLINNHFDTLTPEVKNFMSQFIQKYDFDKIKNYVDNIQGLKTLVIGDVIIDEYVFCDIYGLMSKDRGYSTRYVKEEQYLGGSLAVARHIAQFSDNVTVCSVIGNESNIHSKILNDLGKEMHLDLDFSDSYATVTKRRYIMLNEKRNELDKLFSVNNLQKNPSIEGKDKTIFYEKIESIISKFDLVVICDFGHGLFNNDLIGLIQNKAKFLTVNCQTNSSNYGTNLITKYQRADLFSLDQKELKLAFSDSKSDEFDLLKRLNGHFNSSGGFLTQGSYGAAAIDICSNVLTCPAFTLTVKDTIGAGDAFFSLASISAAANVPLDASLFLSNIAGALATNIMGNKNPVEKVNLLKYAKTLMNI